MSKIKKQRTLSSRSIKNVFRIDYEAELIPRVKNQPITVEYQKKIEKCQSSLKKIQEGWKTFEYDKVNLIKFIKKVSESNGRFGKISKENLP